MLPQGESHAFDSAGTLPSAMACRCDTDPLSNLFEWAPFAVLVTDPASGRFRFVNRAGQRLLGYDRDSFTRLVLSDIIPDAQLLRLLTRSPHPATAPAARSAPVRVIRKDGVELRVGLTPYRALLENRTYWISIIEDQTTRSAIERELRLAAAAFEQVQDGILITDGNLRVERVNKAFCRMFGYSPAESIGRRPRDLLRPDYDRWVLYQDPWRVLDEGAVWQGEVVARRKVGEQLPVRLRIHRVRSDSATSQHAVTVVSDLSGRKEAEHQIHRLAYYDVLTDLPNRSLLSDHLRRALSRARERGRRSALLCLDLDRFKDINDTLGPATGNELLRLMADRLRTVLREEDFIARMGGDEFAIVLEGVRDEHSVALVGDKVLNAFAHPCRLGDTEMVLGVSIGIALFPDHAGDPDTLLRHADTALYRAKEQGRNLYRFYTPELGQITSERFHIERELRRTLEQGELQIHYQPQARAADASMVGGEALLRWQHPERGWISPAQFIPIAEESGLILELGRWVLQQACADAYAWNSSGLRPIRVAVNLSGKQVIDGRIVDIVAEALDSSGLVPEQLELEITESFVIKNPEQGIRTLNALKALGVSLSMDDFGTGYSSLSYLHRFPIDRVKIDRTFIAGLPGDNYGVAITSSILAIAHTLGMEVVAEGVETAEQLAFLRDKGCDEIQGYYLCRPQPASRFLAFYRRLARLSPHGRGEAWAVVPTLQAADNA